MVGWWQPAPSAVTLITGRTTQAYRRGFTAHARTVLVLCLVSELEITPPAGSEIMALLRAYSRLKKVCKSCNGLIKQCLWKCFFKLLIQRRTNQNAYGQKCN